MNLLALQCPQCNEPLTPQNEDLVVVCTQCYTVVQINDDGLSRLTLTYAAPEIGATVTHWYPFWVFDGRTHLIKREIQGGTSSEDAAKTLWGQARRYYVPAWDLPLRQTQDMGRELILKQPVFQAIPQPELLTLTPVVVTPHDAVKLLEFTILAIEARREDWLKKLAFRLQVLAPSLWALPADGNTLVAEIVGM